MAQKRGARSKKKNNNNLSTILIIVLVAVIIIALLVYLFGFNGIDKVKEMLNANQTNDPAPSTYSEDFDGEYNSYTYASVLSGKNDFTLPSKLDGKCLEVHFLNIGQGDAIVIMLPDGKRFIIDAGSGTQYNPEKNDIYQSYITNNLCLGIIDYLLITHPDADHVNLATNILNNFEVKNIYYNEYYASGTNTYKAFCDKAHAEEGANIVEIGSTAQTFSISNAGYTIDIYAPGNKGFSGAESKTNSMSIMCVLSYGGRKVMFTGDAEKKTEQWFMNRVGGDQLDVDILKVGHHGSHSCTSEEFVKFIKPEYAVISCDDGTAYKHPHQETMTTLNTYGIATYRTNRHGNIALYLDEDGDFMFLPQIKATVENNSKNRDPHAILLKSAA